MAGRDRRAVLRHARQHRIPLEAGGVLGREDLCERASRRLLSVIETARASGDYRWTGGTTSRFNLGLFRGIAALGYTALRRIEPSLPNVVIWE